MAVDRLGERARILERLIELQEPIEPLLIDLARFGWESEPLVVISAGDVEAVLRRFLAGELTGSQVEAWADALECRDDVEANPGVQHALVVLSTPEINEPLTADSAQRLIARLGSAPRPHSHASAIARATPIG